jgi:hypothetical protein
MSGLSELLLTAAENAGCTDLTTIEDALGRSAFSQQSLVGAVIATGAVPENDFLKELAVLLRMEWREESDVTPMANVRTLFPARLALGFQILPEAKPEAIEGEEDKSKELRLLVWDPLS